MKLQNRLLDNSFSSDDGLTPPVLQEALKCLDLGQLQVKVAHALVGCRLFLAMDPYLIAGKEYERLGLTPVSTSCGMAVAAFSSVKNLNDFDSKARPYPIHAQRLALLAAQDPGKLVVDPNAKAVVLGRDALYSVGAGDLWLAPWDDKYLKQNLLSLLKSEVPFAILCFLRPGPGGKLIIGLSSSNSLNIREVIEAGAKCLKEFFSKLQRLGEIEIIAVPVPD